MMERKWTEAQRDAITSRDGSILVSAAAGSGKTAVLAERVAERICDHTDRMDADRLLIVTFTKDAAAEMRNRITERLDRKIREQPKDAFLHRQKKLLEHAQISTIHSFCSRLAKEYFYKLDISPNFLLGDGKEGKIGILRNEVLDRVISDGFESERSSFLQLRNTVCGDRDDEELKKAVDRLYTVTRAQPFPDDWMDEQLCRYDQDIPVGKTVWGRFVLEEIRMQYERLMERMAGLRSSVRNREPEARNYFEQVFDKDIEFFEGKKSVFCSNDWNTVCSGLNDISMPRVNSGGRPKFTDTLSADPSCVYLKEKKRKAPLDDFKKNRKLFPDMEQIRKDMGKQKELMAELFLLTKTFAQFFQEEKRKKKCADYDDLEHWAISLLYDRAEDGSYCRSRTAEEISRQFEEVIVDEYQDTNRAQDMIIRAVSREEKNLFLVGDVKQSIYGFRNTSPDMFLERRDAYPKFDRDSRNYPAYLVLDRNFRSRKEVTDTVNYLCSMLMSRRSAGLDYDEEEILVPAADYPEGTGYESEMILLDMDGKDQDDNEDSDEIYEARECVRRIEELVDSGLLIRDADGQRPVRYGDIAVLVRSNRSMTVFEREMRQHFPVRASREPGFFETTEIRVILSLLRVISNPKQDIPLLSLLMGPLYGFTPDEAAQIRMSCRRAPLYTAVKAAAASMPKAEVFLEDLQEYRVVASTLSAEKMIQYIYMKTGYFSIVQSMTDSERRLANLQLLLEQAREAEAAGYRGIVGFVRMTDRMEANRTGAESAKQPAGSDAAVRLMTIHKSKGLEFPVCILPGCGKKFADSSGGLRVDPLLGPALRFRNDETPGRRNSLIWDTVGKRIHRKELAEELRILYVAMTRAREKLIMIGRADDLTGLLAKSAEALTGKGRVSPSAVLGAGRKIEWFLPCLLSHPDGGVLREMTEGGDTVEICGSDFSSRMRISLKQPLSKSEGEQKDAAVQVSPDPDLLRRFDERLSWRYPYEVLAGVPSKVTASALAERDAGQMEGIHLQRPSFLSKQGLTPAERGTATHTFLQFCDFDSAEKDLEQEIRKLTDSGFLQPEQAEAVDQDTIRRFLSSTVYHRMRSARFLKRECLFTAMIDAKHVSPEAEGGPPQQVVLQGAVDCVFLEDGELVILDYKTDRIGDPMMLWNRYQKQLMLYGIAMEQCLGYPVREKLLYSFHTGKTIRGPQG